MTNLPKNKLIRLKPRMEFNFSVSAHGTIWKSALSAAYGIMILEIRDAARRRTSFSAIHVADGSWLWQDIMLEEPWWIGLDGAQGRVALLSVFTETSNPDRKALIAFDILDCKMRWWKNDFALSKAGSACVSGVSQQFGYRELTLDLMSGDEIPCDPQTEETLPLLRPLQYVDGHPYFATVQTFLASRFNLSVVHALEYLEASSLIFISCYSQDENGLTNDFLVLSTDGKLLLREIFGTHLKGIGQDTFFIYDGSVIFVRNRGELISYRIV